MEQLEKEEQQGDEMGGVPPLKLPPFQSRIPANLIDSLSPRDREVLVTLNVMAQQQDWASANILLHNTYIRELDKRQRKIERWKMLLVNKWSPFVYLGLLIIPFILNRIIDKYL